MGLTSNLADLIKECGEDCVLRAYSCFMVCSPNNRFYSFCCGHCIALCALTITSFEDWYNWQRCVNCLCGSMLDRVHGRDCICRELASLGGSPSLWQQWQNYLTARRNCQRGNPCAGKTQTQFEYEGEYDLCGECFFFPWPSCYDVCMNGATGACAIAYGICAEICAARCGYNPIMYTLCMGCCAAAQSECKQIAESGECD